MNGHINAREKFLESLELEDQGQNWYEYYGSKEKAAELVSELLDCVDIIPNTYCQILVDYWEQEFSEFKNGGITYSEAVQLLSNDLI